MISDSCSRRFVVASAVMFTTVLVSLDRSSEMRISAPMVKGLMS